jgi:integrase
MQKLVIAKKGQKWYLRYRTSELITNRKGEQVRKEVWEPVAPVDERYRTKRDVEFLAREIFERKAIIAEKPGASQRLSDFIENKYFPSMESKLRRSTVFGYKHIFTKHIKSRLEDIRLFDFDAAVAQKLIRKIANDSGLSHTSLKHIKHFLAGVITFAIQEGDLRLPANPIQLIETPKGEESEETYAYNLDEIAKMMAALPEPAKTVVVTAAFTGLRRSELRGIRWEDLDSTGDQLYIKRTVWNTYIEDKTKTKASKAPVTLISRVKTLLEAHRNGFPANGFIFYGEKLGRPLNLSNLARRVIAPTLKGVGVKWVGWHGFRRGLATNLDELGVDHDVIKSILRHANVRITEEHYIKSRRPRPAVQKALAQVDKAFDAAVENARKIARKHSAEKHEMTA